MLFKRYIMNVIVGKFSLAGDKFIPEPHSRETGCRYICRPFTEDKIRIQKFK